MNTQEDRLPISGTARRYPAIRETVRMKKSAHACLIKDIRGDSTRRGHWIEGFVLTLCNGRLTPNEIARCVSAAYGMDADTARSVTERLMRELAPFIDWFDAPRVVKARYDMEQFFGTAKPLDAHSRCVSPIGAVLALTGRCDYRCIYCFNSSGPEKADIVSTDTWRKLLRELRETTDCFNILLTGGEPMLHPGFFELLSEIYRLDMIADISTNGSLIDEDAAKRMWDAGQRRILISLDSAQPDTHHRMTGSRGTFDRVLNGINILIRQGFTVDCKSLLVPENYEGAGELALLLDDIGVSGQMFDTYHMDPRGRGGKELTLSREPCARVEQTLNEIRPKLKNLVCSFSPGKGDWGKIENAVSCGAMCETLHVAADGSYQLCDALSADDYFALGKYPEVSVMEAWNSPRVNQILYPPKEACAPVCRECAQFELCRTGCFKAKLIAGVPYYAPDPRCPKAKNAKYEGAF